MGEARVSLRPFCIYFNSSPFSRDVWKLTLNVVVRRKEDEDLEDDDGDPDDME